MGVRPPAVAGQFYPGAPRPLAAAVDAYVEAAGPPPPGPAPKAIIAPHAGYVYSGPIAGSAYARIQSLRGQVRRVVLLGPAHRVPVRGLALPAAAAFETPLGRVPVDPDAAGQLAELGYVEVSDRAHALEHSLEVQLPFLQQVLTDFALVPLVVGQARPEEVAAVLEQLWGGPGTLIVVSSDLSHYLDYDTARRLDRATSSAIEALRPEAIAHDQACGQTPICGLLLQARQRGLAAVTVDLRSSGDTAGPRDQVVGYGAYVFN
ncbi:MAG: AmmeMemoRadiSam system protein B [Gemmatimonadota bacterium]